MLKTIRLESKNKIKEKNFTLDCNKRNSNLQNYNGLKDMNLQRFFYNKRKRKLLKKMGLVNFRKK